MNLNDTVSFALFPRLNSDALEFVISTHYNYFKITQRNLAKRKYCRLVEHRKTY